MIAATQHTSLDIILPHLILGLILSALIGGVAYRRGSLSQSGVLGAIITGTFIFGFGGWAAGLTLIAFFVSSSLLSHFKANSAQKQRAAENFDKGGQRDMGQVLANGGAATAFAILSAIWSEHWALWTGAFVGALASVNADTWATELGVLSKSPPRLITQPGRVVEPGASGGVTLAGTLAALAGALFIGVIFAALSAIALLLSGAGDRPDRPLLVAFDLIIAAAIGGLVGSLFDSFLGATVQAMYFSDTRNKETEKAIEHDGTPNRLIRGRRWLNNDWVNFISSVIGATLTAAIVLLTS